MEFSRHCDYLNGSLTGNSMENFSIWLHSSSCTSIASPGLILHLIGDVTFNTVKFHWKFSDKPSFKAFKKLKFQWKQKLKKIWHWKIIYFPLSFFTETLFMWKNFKGRYSIQRCSRSDWNFWVLLRILQIVLHALSLCLLLTFHTFENR